MHHKEEYLVKGVLLTCAGVNSAYNAIRFK